MDDRSLKGWAKIILGDRYGKTLRKEVIKVEYLAEMYGKRSPDFVHGFLAALDTYAIWRNGIQVIGRLEEPLKDVKRKAINALAEHPETFRKEMIE